jgi:putative flippase GtrA
MLIVNKFKQYLLIIKSDQKIRFLLVGGYNFVFNYLIGLILFKFTKMGIYKITIFYFFGVIHNFITHKIFSFRLKKFCKIEFLRALAVYGFMYIFSTIFLLFLIKIGSTQIVAYHINLVISLFIFYFLHCLFTFRVKI